MAGAAPNCGVVLAGNGFDRGAEASGSPGSGGSVEKSGSGGGGGKFGTPAGAGAGEAVPIGGGANGVSNGGLL